MIFGAAGDKFVIHFLRSEISNWKIKKWLMGDEIGERGGLEGDFAWC